MGVSVNSDGLVVRYGADEGDRALGGELKTFGPERIVTAKIKYTDALSTTAKLIGNGTATNDGTVGIVIPKGARIKAVEIIVKTAFTSSGTLASATLPIGLIKASDRSTTLDLTAFTTTAFVGSNLDTAGKRSFLTIGSTGVGTQVGATISENGYLVVANSTHGTNPYTAGEIQLNVIFYDP
jgi:hypothetical protein